MKCLHVSERHSLWARQQIQMGGNPGKVALSWSWGYKCVEALSPGRGTHGCAASTASSPCPGAEAASLLVLRGLHGRNHYCNEKPRNVLFPALWLLLTQNGCQAYK